MMAKAKSAKKVFVFAVIHIFHNSKVMEEIFLRRQERVLYIER